MTKKLHGEVAHIPCCRHEVPNIAGPALVSLHQGSDLRRLCLLRRRNRCTLRCTLQRHASSSGGGGDGCGDCLGSVVLLPGDA